MNGASDPKDDADLDAEWRRAFDWIETTLSARITRFERQPRWRPAFSLEAERGDEVLSLHLRGERGELDHGLYPLDHEARVLRVLEEEGIPVPHVHGFCLDPPAILMDQVPGRIDLSTAEDEGERKAVLYEYMDVLADLHAIDPARFESIGVERPADPRSLALMDFGRWRETYSATRRSPDALIEFLTGWVLRNLPLDRHEVSCLQIDSGQFLFERGHLTGLIDFELACLGDPAADLAAMRGRHMQEPLGDLEPAFDRYFDRRGARIPSRVIDFHTVRFNLNTLFTCRPLIDAPPRSADLVQYLGWHWIWALASVQVISAARGVVTRAPTIMESEPSPHSNAHAFLTEKLAALRDGQQGFLAYELDTAWRTASHLSRVDAMGAAMAAEEAEEIDRLLGRVTTPIDREADFEAFVRDEGEKREEELLEFFERRCLRQEALIGPSLRELYGSRTQILS